MQVAVVIPAGGSGQRMGSQGPKQMMMHRGKSMLEWSLLPFLSLGKHLECIVIPLPKPVFEHPPAWLLELSDRVVLCVGGATRQQSVHEGFKQLMARGLDSCIWLVHDAARPLLAQKDLTRLVEKIESTGEGGLLALPVRDTLKREHQNGQVLETLDRRYLWQAQTPQGGPGEKLWAASSKAVAENQSVTDDASLLELAGHTVHLVEGNPLNFKVTHPQDWELFQRLF
jgi:2-C-methyl-D-erythritol 4-phosphate cytidylyltransferase